MRRIAKGIGETVSNHPWIFGGAMFLAFVGVAAAANVAGVLEHEGAFEKLAGFANVDLAESMRESIKSMSETEVCKELYSYINMCNLFSQNFVNVEEGIKISSCATGENFGQANNAAAMMCNVVKLMKAYLPEDTLERCAEMAKSMKF